MRPTGQEPKVSGRVSTRELRDTPSHLYQRLLRGEINSLEYVRVVKRAVDRKLGRE